MPPLINAAIDWLGYYPLALNHAGRFRQESQITFVEFLKRYDERLQYLIKQQNGSISATLSLSHEILKARGPPTAAILGLLDVSIILIYSMI